MSKASASGLVDDDDFVDQRNPGAGINGLKRKEKAVVLIHGWNSENKVNPLEVGEWKYLSEKLQEKLNRTSKDWAIVNFNWALSAATGGIGGIFTAPLSKSVSPPVVAVVNANIIGYSYARSLASICPKLRRVHFIAHSAGVWLARSSMLELTRLNPMVICELTLLDPFVPGRGEGVENPYVNARLEELTAPAISNRRVWWAQNLYSQDILTNYFTKGDLNWVGGLSSGQNFLVDNGGKVSYNPYGSHAGPIRYYADTIAASIPNYDPPDDLNTTPNPPAWRDYGAESGFWNAEAKFPKVLDHFPKDNDNISRPYGQKVQLKVILSDSSDYIYKWYLLQDRGFESGQILTPVPAPLIGNRPTIEVTVGSSKMQYVCEIENNFHRKTFSSIFSVSPDLGAALIPTPSISGISPVSPSADIVGPQLIDVTGSGFQASANTTVILTSPTGVISTYIPTVISSTNLSFNHSFLGQPGPWTLVIKKDTNSSAQLTFRAISANPSTVPRVLSRISVENLPGTILEGQTASNVKIRIFYSDGTDDLLSSITSANWNIQYSAILFSPPGTFTAAQVTSDTFCTVTATYSEGGITKSYQTQITVLNNTSTGGVVTGDIVKNGTLGKNGAYWTTNYADFRITSDYSFGGHAGGYAWMATPTGGQGNNLAGAFSQVIDLPSNASQLSLKFSCAISVQNPSAATSTDRVSVILRDENDFNPVNLISVDPVNQPASLGQWVTYSVDLTAFKGTRKKLVFGGSTDYSNPATLRVDDVRVEITAASPIIVDLAITGPDVVKEGTVASYEAIASDSTGVASEVTTSATWSVNENASISGGTLTAQQVIAQRTARITASYSSGGITKSVSKDVTILDNAPVPVSLAIYGPSQVHENSGGMFSAVMLLSSGVYQEVSNSVYWSFTGTGGQVDPIGRLYTNEVAADTVMTVKASYEKDGVTVTAEAPLTILDRLPPVLPISMAIVGPSSVDEAGIGLFDSEVTYADGSKKFVSAFWQENSRFTTISEHGVLACEQVLSNQVVTLSASFTENLSTVTATKSVTIANTLNTIAKPEFTMPAAIKIPVDRQFNLRLQTAHPAVSATATGLPSGLTFNSSTFEIQGTPLDVGTWEIKLSATNDFGTSTGLLLLTTSEDAGPEWIRFTKAEAATFPVIGVAGDGEGGCYLFGYNNVAHRNAAGVIDYNTGPMGIQIQQVSGSPNGFAVTGRFDSTFSVGGRTINKFPNGEGQAVVIVFNKQGQALRHETARSSNKNVNAGDVILNPDGSVFWGINYFAAVSFENLGVGLELLNPANVGQSNCALIKINPDSTFAWGHRWGGNQYEELLEIASVTSHSCRVKILSASSTLTRQAMQHPGLFTTSWTRGNSPGQWSFVETVFERGGIADCQFESPNYDSFMQNVISDPLDHTRYWVAGNFKTSAPFKRYYDGNMVENNLLPAASNGQTSGFVIKSGFYTQTSPTALFRSLAPTVYGLSELRTSRLAAMSDGSLLSTGTYTPSFDYNGTRFLDSPQDYEQLQPKKRAFIAGHDTANNMRWVLACGGVNGGDPRALENVGGDKWLLLINCSGDAKFGRLPIIPGGGTLLVDIERKVQQAESEESNESSLSDTDRDGLSDSDEINITQTNPLLADTNGNGVNDALEDADNDGILNGREVNQLGTNPLLADSNANGLSDTYELVFRGNIAPFVPRVGDRVRYDLSQLGYPGTYKLVGKLPSGLSFNPVTAVLEGKFTGAAGTSKLIIQILNGKTVLRSIPLNLPVSAFPASLAGTWQALLENEQGQPEGLLTVVITAPGKWSANYDGTGTRTIRMASGLFDLTAAQEQATWSITFPAMKTVPAVTMRLGIEGRTALAEGTHARGTLRGFRFARGAELPVATRAITLLIDQGTQDGFLIPAGMGWATGSLSNRGVVSLKGQLGDAQAWTTSLSLGATGQALMWLKPYKNVSSYLGGIVSLHGSGSLPASTLHQQESGLVWYRAADAKELAYPAGFAPMSVSVGVRSHLVPTSALALSQNLGLTEQVIRGVVFAGGGLPNPSAFAKLPEAFALDASYKMIALPMPGQLMAPWQGAIAAQNGGFSGSLSVVASNNGTIAGNAAVSGVLFPTNGSAVVGAGVVKIPTSGSKGAFRTGAILLGTEKEN